MTRSRLLLVIGCLLAPIALYLFLWPIAADPIAWSPPIHDPDRWHPSDAIARAERIDVGARGPEGVEVDGGGRIFAGVEDGRILVIDGGSKRVLADTGGRPLGLAWAKDGRLLVTDADRGLLAITPEGTVAVLTSTCAGTPLLFADDLDVAADGTIWFSDASTKFHQPEWKLDIVESRANGRLCAYDPSTKQTREVLRDLYFANGVALDPAGQFVLVNETSRYRVRKVFIDGPRRGETEMAIENLPGFPDNLSSGTDGIFWIAIASPRNALIDLLAGSPVLRKVILRLPEAIQPKPERTARVIGIDASGQVRFDLFDPTGTPIFMITSIEERGGHLYFGSLQDSAVARMPAPQGGGV